MARTKRRFSSKQTKSKTGDLDARSLTCKSTMSEANVIFENKSMLMCYIFDHKEPRSRYRH